MTQLCGLGGYELIEAVNQCEFEIENCRHYSVDMDRTVMRTRVANAYKLIDSSTSCAEFIESANGVERILLGERNYLMSYRLRDRIDMIDLMRTTTQNKNFKEQNIVMVVGEDHVEGIAQIIKNGLFRKEISTMGADAFWAENIAPLMFPNWYIDRMGSSTVDNELVWYQVLIMVGVCIIVCISVWLLIKYMNCCRDSTDNDSPATAIGEIALV